MNKDIELLKERIIAWVDERDKPYVIPLLNDLENAIHEHSFDNGYETGYDNGLERDSSSSVVLLNSFSILALRAARVK